MSKKGYKMSEECKHKISQSKKGQESPNKGKFKYDRSIIVRCACGCGQLRPKYDKKGRERNFINGHYGSKMTLGMKNVAKRAEVREKIRKANTGKKQSKETIRKRIFSCLGKHNAGKTYEEIFGEKRAKELKNNSSFSRIGRKLPLSWGTKISNGVKRNPPKTIFKKGEQRIKEIRAKLMLPKKDTSIEIKIQNFLKQLNIEFFTHQYIKIEHGYQCDILIPSMNLIIECDGVYWHHYPTGKEIDHIRTKELLEKGFKVLRLWEFEIKSMDLNEFRNKLWKN